MVIVDWVENGGTKLGLRLGLNLGSRILRCDDSALRMGLGVVKGGHGFLGRKVSMFLVVHDSGRLD